MYFCAKFSSCSEMHRQVHLNPPGRVFGTPPTVFSCREIVSFLLLIQYALSLFTYLCLLPRALHFIPYCRTSTAEPFAQKRLFQGRGLAAQAKQITTYNLENYIRELFSVQRIFYVDK